MVSVLTLKAGFLELKPGIKLDKPSMVRTSGIHHFQGAPLITLQRRQLVGHDILLARHGNHICSMRVDRSSGRVVALLDDGTIDSAPNLIAPGLELPATVGSVLREDWKILAVCGAVAAGMGALMVTAAVSLGSMTDPTTIEMLSAYTIY
jgi:hypothetical protein